MLKFCCIESDIGLCECFSLFDLCLAPSEKGVHHARIALNFEIVMESPIKDGLRRRLVVHFLSRSRLLAVEPSPDVRKDSIQSRICIFSPFFLQIVERDEVVSTTRPADANCLTLETVLPELAVLDTECLSSLCAVFG